MSITPPALPASYSWGFVVGQVIHAIGDQSGDADRNPQSRPASGSVTFTPLERLKKVTTNPPAFVVHETVSCGIGPTGELIDEDDQMGVWLITGDYLVTFNLDGGATIPSFPITVTGAHTLVAPLDLVTAAPYVPQSGVTVNTMLVPADAVIGQVLGWSASGLDWVDMGGGGGGGAVSSVAGRTGAVVLSSADLTDVASLATDAELTSGLAGKANASHTHAPADITGTAVITTDPRLSDARTPTAHTHPASAISDSTATGRSLLAAADAAAARTAIGAGTSNLAIGTSGTTAAAGNRQATETAIGMVELATTAEAQAGTDATRAVTPAGLKAVADTKANATHSHTSAQVTDFTEATQDVVGAMVTGAGGTYDDGAGTITLPSGGGGGITPASSIPPNVGEYFPVFAYGGHQEFGLISGWLIPCPVLVETAGHTDAVALNVASGAAGVTVELALYSWGRTASHVVTFGTVDVSSAGLKTITFTPHALAAGRYVVVARPIGGNVTVWGITGGVMVVQKGPDAGNNTYGFPHAAAGSMPASIEWNYNAGLFGNAFPKLMLRRSA